MSAGGTFLRWALVRMTARALLADALHELEGRTDAVAARVLAAATGEVGTLQLAHLAPAVAEVPGRGQRSTVEDGQGNSTVPDGAAPTFHHGARLSAELEP